MPYRLPVNEPVRAHVRFADLTPGDFGASVKLKADIDGTTEHVYLPGAAADVVTQLHDCGVVREIPATFPAAGEKPVALALAAHDVVLELVKAAPRARARLVVTVAAPEATAPLSPPRSPASAPALRPAAAKPRSSTSAAAEPAEATLDDARARCEKRCRAVTAAFREALETAGTELLPIFAAHGVPVHADVMYKCAFTIFQSWRESGAR